MKKTLLVVLSFVLLTSTISAADPELGILYFVMASDAVIFTDALREMNEAEMFASNPRLKKEARESNPPAQSIDQL